MDELKQKEQEYRDYIKEHQSNVFEVFCKFMNFCMKIGYKIGNKIDYNTLHDNIIKHDESKYSFMEFYDYRRTFYPTDDERNQWSCGFDMAWNHHQKVNPHHWEHWIKLNGECLEMVNEYIIEMLCDWTAMSLKFNNVPSEWYEENKHKMIFHPLTEQKVEFWLPMFDEVYELLTNKE